MKPIGNGRWMNYAKNGVAYNEIADIVSVNCVRT